MTRPTLLIPVTFPNPQIHPLTDIDVDTLDGFDIILLGYWELSESTTVEEARREHATAAEAVLYELAAAFSHAGAWTDIQLEFGSGGPERRELQRRIVEDANPDGVLRADQVSTIHNVLVPLRDNRHKDSIVRFVSAFDADNIFVVELYHAVPEVGGVEAAKAMLQAVEDDLRSRGFSESDLEITVEVTEDPTAAITAKARNHNIVVMGETEEWNDEKRVYGAISNDIIEHTNTPVIIVR